MSENGRPTCLDEAAAIVTGGRQDDYGHPHENHSAMAKSARAYIWRRYSVDVPLDAEDWCALMLLCKVYRHAHRRTQDNRVDMAGYALNMELCAEREAAGSE